jgi:hypothetical protein
MIPDSDPPPQPPSEDPLVRQLCRRLKTMVPSCAACHRDPTLACTLGTLGRDLPERQVPDSARRRLGEALKRILGH